LQAQYSCFETASSAVFLLIFYNPADAKSRAASHHVEQVSSENLASVVEPAASLCACHRCS
jgi:hypothetical protein